MLKVRAAHLKKIKDFVVYSTEKKSFKKWSDLLAPLSPPAQRRTSVAVLLHFLTSEFSAALCWVQANKFAAVQTNTHVRVYNAATSRTSAGAQF